MNDDKIYLLDLKTREKTEFESDDQAVDHIVSNNLDAIIEYIGNKGQVNWATLFENGRRISC